MIVADRVVLVQCMEQVPGSASTVRRLKLTVAIIVYNEFYSTRGHSDVGSWLPKLSYPAKQKRFSSNPG